MRATAFAVVVLAACSRSARDQSGPPVRLSAGASDTVIVNTRSPTQLRVGAYDAAGSLVPAAPIHFEPAAGTMAPVSPDGIATCDTSADYTVRGKVDAISHPFVIRCRPIKVLRLLQSVQFVLGDSALSLPYELPLEALSADRRVVNAIAGIVKVIDTSVAYARGSTVIPRVRGVTVVGAWVGEQHAFTGVHVYQRVGPSVLDTLLRVPGVQRQFAVPVQLKPAESWRRRLPPGDWMLTTLSPSRQSRNGFRLRFENATCQGRILNEPGRFVCKSSTGTTVIAERDKASRDTAAAMTYLLVRTIYPPAPTIPAWSR